VSRNHRAFAALVTLAVLAAGCSKAPAGTSTGTSAAATDRDKAVAFAQCMREHGVAAFPDPDASGQLTIDGVVNGSSVDPDSATFEQARTACKDLEPSGFTGHRRNAEQQAAALVFADCIRHHGVEDFPDPDPDAPLIDTNEIPSAGRSGGMSALHAAMDQCRSEASKAIGQ
jgi:hypothetical protein